jgi:hypothetical protein
VSLAESFLKATKQILLVTENIKRLDDKVHSLAGNVSEIDRRLLRMETMVELTQGFSRGRSLPGKIR